MVLLIYASKQLVIFAILFQKGNITVLRTSEVSLGRQQISIFGFLSGVKIEKSCSFQAFNTLHAKVRMNFAPNSSFHR